MSDPSNAATEPDLSRSELARILHIDEDNEAELDNAELYKLSAEEYLTGAGVSKDYSSGLYKQLVIALTARAAERPDALTKFEDAPGSGLVAMIVNLRTAQAVKEAAE